MSGSISGILRSLVKGEKALNVAIISLYKNKGDKDAIKRLRSVLRSVRKNIEIMENIKNRDFSKLPGFDTNLKLVRKLIKKAMSKDGEDVLIPMYKSCFSSRDAHMSILRNDRHKGSELAFGVWLFGDSDGMTMNDQSTLDEEKAFEIFKSVLEDAIYESYDSLDFQ